MSQLCKPCYSTIIRCVTTVSLQYKSYEEDLHGALTSQDTVSEGDVTLTEELAELLADNSEPPTKKQVGGIFNM